MLALQTRARVRRYCMATFRPSERPCFRAVVVATGLVAWALSAADASDQSALLNFAEQPLPADFPEEGSPRTVTALFLGASP